MNIINEKKIGILKPLYFLVKEEYLNNLARLLVHIKGLTNVVVGNPADNEY